MSVVRNSRLGIAGCAILAATMLGACSDSTPTSPSSAAAGAVSISPVSALLTSSDVIVPGSDLGGFFNVTDPTNATRDVGAFWDNPSNDGPDCNIGFYALGTMVPPPCLDQAPGSDANQGFGYTKYWGDAGPGGTLAGRDAASFMFKGTNSYVVTLRGSYAGGTSELGWFTKVGDAYTFHPVNPWGAKTINSSVTIFTGGQDWGFYIHSDQAPLAGGCGLIDLLHDCSDAFGGYDIINHTYLRPVQQFALFSDPSDPSRYLVGAEDNQLEILTASGFDADYQDYVWSIVATPVPVFVIGDVEAHGLGANVNFWGAQWWKNNTMSGLVSSGVASFKGYATDFQGGCGGTWTTRPGNSSNPPAVIGDDVIIIVTSKVLKNGANISGDIAQILSVHQDGGYGPNPGHAGNGVVTTILCPQLPD